MNVSVRSKSIDSTSQNNEIVTIPEEMEELEEIESLDEEDNDSDVTEDLSDDGDEHFVDDDGTGSRQDLAEDTDTLSQAANSDSHCRTAVSETTSATYINGSSYLSLDDLKSPIWPSLFSEGEATLYFPTPDEKLRPLNRSIASILKWKVNKGSPRVIRNALKSVGFKLMRNGSSWIGYWGKHWTVDKYKALEPFQRMSHFPMSFEVGRKDKMYINNKTLFARFPAERRELKNTFAKYALWILKPPANARGNGIRVISRWSDIPRKKSYLCSRYIQNPYLINQRKFDLRLYVLIPSFDPLRVYLYRDGLVRFASEDYSSDRSRKNVKNRFMHLTNYSVSKKNTSGGASDDIPAKEGLFAVGSKFSMADNKWSLETLFEYFDMVGVDHVPVMDRIRKIIVKTMMSVHTQNTTGTRIYVPNGSCCFELFGFDVLLDAQLNPWLMEVNISPSMKASCDLDFQIKTKLSRDMFNLVGIRMKDLELARNMLRVGSLGHFSWQKTLLTSTERIKQRRVVLEGQNPLLDLNADDIKKLREFEDEYKRKGEFDLLYPSREYANHAKYFTSFNYYDRLLLSWIASEKDLPKRISFLKNFEAKSTMMLPTELKSDLKKKTIHTSVDSVIEETRKLKIHSKLHPNQSKSASTPQLSQISSSKSDVKKTLDTPLKKLPEPIRQVPKAIAIPLPTHNITHRDNDVKLPPKPPLRPSSSISRSEKLSKDKKSSSLYTFEKIPARKGSFQPVSEFLIHSAEELRLTRKSPSTWSHSPRPIPANVSQALRSHLRGARF